MRIVFSPRVITLFILRSPIELRHATTNAPYNSTELKWLKFEGLFLNFLFWFRLPQRAFVPVPESWEICSPRHIFINNISLHFSLRPGQWKMQKQKSHNVTKEVHHGSGRIPTPEAKGELEVKINPNPYKVVFFIWVKYHLREKA